MADRLDRVGTRGVDASDANVVVAQAQCRLDISDVGSWHRIEAGESLDKVAAVAGAILKLR
jgi:hypothetical protein